MPNVNAVINEQIRRLSRREITANTRVMRKASAHFRRDIAALKRQVVTLTMQLAIVKRHQPTELTAAPEVLEKARFRAMGVKAHRRKLGLSAADYGKLVEVSPLTIYSWESGKSRPRKAQMARWLVIRGLGKREAMERLGLAEPKVAAAQAKASGKPRPRGRFKQTGEQSILSLLKGRKSLTTSQLNDAWRREGRAGKADVTLGLMVKARKLRRIKIKGERGSRYSVRG